MKSNGAKRDRGTIEYRQDRCYRWRRGDRYCLRTLFETSRSSSYRRGPGFDRRSMFARKLWLRMPKSYTATYGAQRNPNGAKVVAETQVALQSQI